MKHVLALAAIAGILFWGCAPRPESRGGAFDPTIAAEETPAANESGLRLSPGHRTLGPKQLPGNSPGMLPDEGNSDDNNPEFMLPRHKYEVLHI